MSRRLTPEDSGFPKIAGGVAIVAGHGVLPRLLAEEFARREIVYRVVIFNIVALEWAAKHPTIPATFEGIGPLFEAIHASGCNTITFAGGLPRPKLDLSGQDAGGKRRAAAMASALRQGDDASLRFFVRMFEAEGLDVIAPQSFLTNLIVQEGIFTEAIPSRADRRDAARAAEIVAALGAVDVGQGAVVAQGICLAVESIQGTDRMLEFVAQNSSGLRPDPAGARGVLFKAPKPDQDLRVDLPAIGAGTIRAAALAGLAGVVVGAGGVFNLEKEETIAEANRLGLFLWGREGTD